MRPIRLPRDSASIAFLEKPSFIDLRCLGDKYQRNARKCRIFAKYVADIVDRRALNPVYSIQKACPVRMSSFSRLCDHGNTSNSVEQKSPNFPDEPPRIENPRNQGAPIAAPKGLLCKRVHLIRENERKLWGTLTRFGVNAIYWHLTHGFQVAAAHPKLDMVA